MKKLLLTNIFFILMIFSGITVAATNDIKCYVQLNKSKIWNNYDVVIHMYDFKTQQLIHDFNLDKAAKKKPSVNQLTYQFDCYKHKVINFTATFTPYIWESAKGEVYPAKHIRTLIKQLRSPPPDMKKLTIKLTFPGDFSIDQDPRVVEEVR